MASRITISIVNYNHRRYLPACLDALRAQTLSPAEVIVVDNASEDGSVAWLQQHAADIRLVANADNRGYAAGHNQAFRLEPAEYVVALNCDVTLAPRFLEEAVKALEEDAETGSACGRLSSAGDGPEERLDSTGLYPDRFRRFHDRDHGEADRGQRRRPDHVFGASGSAAVFRRVMLDDVAVDGEYFDEMFFAYYEDADLAWRAQSRGWSCLFVPEATGTHVHDDLSRARSRRSDSPATFRQMLLMRNRHLCFLKNEPWRDLMVAAPALGAYDLALQAYLTATKPRLAVAWPLSLSQLAGELRRKRRRTFDNARREVRLSDWFQSGRPVAG